MFRKWIDNYVIKRFQKLMPKALITNLYQQIAKADLMLEEKIINVKKGRRRYTLLIMKDRNLQTKFWLGRH